MRGLYCENECSCAHTTKLQDVVVQLAVVLFRNIELQQSIVGLQEGGAERRPLMVRLDGLDAHTCHRGLQHHAQT